MRAMILPEFGAPLRPATVPVPKLGPNDVLLRVRATGVGLTVVSRTRLDGADSRGRVLPEGRIERLTRRRTMDLDIVIWKWLTLLIVGLALAIGLVLLLRWIRDGDK